MPGAVRLVIERDGVRPVGKVVFVRVTVPWKL